MWLQKGINSFTNIGTFRWNKEQRAEKKDIEEDEQIILWAILRHFLLTTVVHKNFGASDFTILFLYLFFLPCLLYTIKMFMSVLKFSSSISDFFQVVVFHW